MFTYACNLGLIEKGIEIKVVNLTRKVNDIELFRKAELRCYT